MIFFKKKEEIGKVEKVEEKVEVPKEEKVERELPIFIRLDRYNQIVSLLNGLKMLVKDITNIITTMNEIERIRNDNFNLLQKTLGRLKEKIEIFDSHLTKPKLLEKKIEIKKEEIESIEESLTKVKDSLERIRVELKTKI